MIDFVLQTYGQQVFRFQTQWIAVPVETFNLNPRLTDDLCAIIGHAQAGFFPFD